VRKLILIIVFYVLSLFVVSRNTYAIVDPLSTPNNKYGIHIIDENDLEDASSLVNSNGGDWGYVTLVIREDERNTLKWQTTFDKMRTLHLIPLVRLATKQTNSHWEKPDINAVNDWVDFLNSLNWVVKNRFVIVGNEPNHAKEWGNKIDPKEYASYLKEISVKLKEKNEDYFILNAGFDASALNSSDTSDEEYFIRQMIKHEPDIFEYIDGWVSHSYPNPDFSGNETDTGRGSIKTYEWEVSLLKSLGVNKDFPVFITETGWKLNAEKAVAEDKINERFLYAYKNAWTDEKIVAITPFILNYQTEPFIEFSWKKNDGSFHKHYYEIANIDKNGGDPKIDNYLLFKNIRDYSISDNNLVLGIALVKNVGQDIWDKVEYMNVDFNGNKHNTTLIFSDQVKPGESRAAFYIVKND